MLLDTLGPPRTGRRTTAERSMSCQMSYFRYFGAQASASLAPLCFSDLPKTKWLDHDAPEWGPIAFYVVFLAVSTTLQGIIADYFWDVFVSPQSETQTSIRQKLIFSHLPTAALKHLFIVLCPRQQLLFVTLNILGIMGAVFLIRWPSFFERKAQVPNYTAQGDCCFICLHRADVRRGTRCGSRCASKVNSGVPFVLKQTYYYNYYINYLFINI